MDEGAGHGDHEGEALVVFKQGRTPLGQSRRNGEAERG